MAEGDRAPDHHGFRVLYGCDFDRIGETTKGRLLVGQKQNWSRGMSTGLGGLRRGSGSAIFSGSDYSPIS